MLKVGFIGLGNMGSAMANSLASSNLAEVVGFDILIKEKLKMQIQMQ